MARSLLLIPCLGLAACVDGSDENIVILQNQVPEPGCVIPGSQDTAFIGSGIIEAGSQLGYRFNPLLKNFADTENATQQDIAFVQGATVDIDVVSGEFDAATLAEFRADGLTHFRVPFAASIEPNETTSLSFEIVPQDLLERLQQELPTDDPTDHALLIITVRVDGRVGSSGFETQAFEYPVEVCNGCLTNVLGACSTIETSFMPVNTGGECNPVQDATVDCCSTSDGLVCPAVGTMTPAVR